MLPVIKVLSYDEVFEVVVYSSLIVLQKCICVSQTVAGLSLHSSVFQLPRQLQGTPKTQAHKPHQRIVNISLYGFMQHKTALIDMVFTNVLNLLWRKCLRFVLCNIQTWRVLSFLLIMFCGHFKFPQKYIGIP